MNIGAKDELVEIELEPIEATVDAPAPVEPTVEHKELEDVPA